MRVKEHHQDSLGNRTTAPSFFAAASTTTNPNPQPVVLTEEEEIEFWPGAKFFPANTKVKFAVANGK
jgi:hypothetical protein